MTVKEQLQQPGVLDPRQHGATSYKDIFNYFYPELITAFLLYIALDIIDFRFIACSNNPLCNSAQQVAQTLFHLLTKVAEGFSVGMVIICGQYNGAHEYHRVGRVVSDVFWAMIIIGVITALSLYAGAYAIFGFYEASSEITALGVPYLRMRSLGVLFMFIYFALIGFLRGVKNTKAPMVLFFFGAAVFLVCDYTLIFGGFGFKPLGLQGSAIAMVAQYAIMCLGAIIYILLEPEYRKFAIKLFSPIKWYNFRDLFHVSWPVMIDKASFAFCYVWLMKLLGILAKAQTPEAGKLLYDSFIVLRQMEKVGILPAVAFAQVITFLISNDYKIHKFHTITNNIKRVLFIASISVSIFSVLFYFWPRFFLSLIGKQAAYNNFIAFSLPFIIILILFDALQLILSASLRGAADVKTVMWSRMIVAGLFFMPLAALIVKVPLDNLLIHFILLYGSIHVGYILMSVIYLIRFRSGAWKEQSIKAKE